MSKFLTPILVLFNACIILGQGTIQENVPQNQDSVKLDTSRGIITTKDSVVQNAVTDSVVNENVSTISDSLKSVDNLKQNIVVISDSANNSKPTNITLYSEEKVSNNQKHGIHSGLGLNLYIKAFDSKDLNDYIEDVFDAWIDDAPGRIVDTPDFSGIYSLIGVKLKTVIGLGSIVAVEPFGFISGGSKLMDVNNVDHDVKIGLLYAEAGINFWAQFLQTKIVSFKAGLGGYANYTIVTFDTYADEVELKGIGYGVNILAGVDVKLNKRIVINVDLAIPVGTSEIRQSGFYETGKTISTIKHPEEYKHIGLEIMPGITFLF